MARIVGGTHGGRKLTTLAGETTRPTSERVREAVFSTMASWLGRADQPVAAAMSGVGFLDLYAGSGAVGLEAASRGAAPVRLVESDRKASATIARNVATLGVAAELTTAPVAAVVARQAPRPYDIVWLDPPYALAQHDLEQVLTDLVVQGWVVDDAMVAVERATRTESPSLQRWFAEVWQRRYGETTVYYGTHVKHDATNVTHVNVATRGVSG